MNHARVVFECIVDGCDWTLEQAEPDLRHVPIDTTGMNHYDAFNAYITASIGEGLRRADHDDTMAARAHLMGYGTLAIICMAVAVIVGRRVLAKQSTAAGAARGGGMR